jgi:hypothetical protein
MAADNAPAAVRAIAAPAAIATPAGSARPVASTALPRRSSPVSAGPGRALSTRVGTRPARLHVRSHPNAPLRALPAAPGRHRGLRTSIPARGTSSTKAVSRSSSWLAAMSQLSAPPPAFADVMTGDRFVLTLLGRAGDTGFLQTIESAGGQMLSGPSSQIVSDAIGQIPVAAPPPGWLPARPVRDRPLRPAPPGHATRRLTASWHASEPPAARPRSARQPVLPVGQPTLVRPSLATGHPQQRPRSGRRDRSARARHATAEPAQASGLPRIAPFAGGPAAGEAGAIASGAAAFVLAAMLVLQTLQLMSARLSLELVPWRSALLTFRLERPG